MYSHKRLFHFSEVMKTLEEHDPLLSLWRTQRDGGRRLGFKKLLQPLLVRARDIKRLHVLRSTPTRGQVVFYASFNTPTGFGTIKPLIRECAARGAIPFVLTNSQTSAAVDVGLSATREDYRNWAAGLSWAAKKGAGSRAAELADRVKNVFGEEYDEEFLANAHAGAVAEAVARQFLGEAGALVLETDYFPAARGLALGARRQGIPVIMIQHGLFGPHQFPAHCDALLCWGEYFRAEAQRYGLDEGVARATGCPRWDIVEGYRQEARDVRVRVIMGEKGGRPLILLLSNTQVSGLHSDVYSRYFRSVRRLLESGCSVAVRLHPAERNIAAYRRLIPESLLARMTVVSSDVSLYDALRHADVVYHVFSTAAIEAMLLDVPVLFTSAEPGSSLTDLPDHGGGAWCSEEEVVESCLGYGVRGAARDRILRRQRAFLESALANRGRATGMTMDVVACISRERASA